MKLAKLLGAGIAVCFLGLAISSSLLADEFKSVASLSIASYNDIDGRTETFLETIGFEELHNVLAMVTNGIDGIDKSKPVGFVLLSDGNELLPFAFFPIADIDALACPGVEVLKEKLHYNSEKKTITIRDDEDAIADEPGSEGELRLIEANNWLFVTPPKFESILPTQTDPTDWLEGLDREYLIGGVLHIDRVPDEVVDSLFSSLRVAASKDEDVAANLENFSALADYIKANLQSLEFGVAIDAKDGGVTFSSTAVPVPASSYARSLEENANPVTLWSDFYAPAHSIFAASKSEVFDSETSKFSREQFDSLIETFLAVFQSEDETEESNLAAFRDVVRDWQVWVDKNIDTGKTDAAFSVGIDGTISLAATITDGNELLPLVEQASELLKKQLADEKSTDVQKFLGSLKINANQYKGFSVSTFVVPISDLDKICAFLIGIKDDAFVMIAGMADAGAAKKVVSDLFKEKAGLERTESEAAQGWVFSVPNLAKFAQTFDEVTANEIAGSLVQKLSGGSDEAVIVGQTECSAQRCRQSVTIKKELVKLICDTVQQILQSEDESGSETEEDVSESSSADDLF